MAAGKHQFALMLSAILPVLSACAQLHGVFADDVTAATASTKSQSDILDINKVAAKLRTCTTVYCCTHKSRFLHEPTECLHEKIWRISALLVRSTQVLKRVT